MNHEVDNLWVIINTVTLPIIILNFPHNSIMNFYIVDLVLQVLHWKMKNYVYHERLFAAFWLHLNYDIGTKLTSDNCRTAVQRRAIYTYKVIWTLFVHRELQLHMKNS